MRIYHMHKSHRGGFLIPHHGSRRLTFHVQRREITKGSGLLLSTNLGGFGVPINKNALSTARRHLSHLHIRGGGISKKKYITF